MRIVVCLKQVPDTTDLRLDPETNTLIREGVAAILNPLDEFPLEAALRLRDCCGATVIAMTMGPPQASAVLHKALSMGTDEGVLVSDREFAGADTWATSLTLARAVQAVGEVDYVFCGKQAIDGDTAQVGPGIAAHLGVPQVTYVTHVNAAADGLELRRLLESGTVALRVRPPAVLTILKEANEPRLPTLADRLRAYETAPRTVDAAELELAGDDVGLSGSPTRVVRIAVPLTQRRRVRLDGDSAEAAARLLDELRNRALID